MTYSTQYFWVVLCKNHRFHKKQNRFFGHSIPLGETDALESPPAFGDQLRVRCDDCGEEYDYKPKEVLRAELEARGDFRPHPLFSA